MLTSFFDTLQPAAQIDNRLLRLMESLLECLAFVRCPDMLQLKVLPLTSQLTFSIRRLLDAGGQLLQRLLGIRNQYRQVEYVQPPSFLFSQSRGPLMDQLFHLPVECLEHLLPLRTFTFERGQRIFEGRSLRRTLLLFLGKASEFFPSLALLLFVEFSPMTLDLGGCQRPCLLLFNLRQFLAPLPDRFIRGGNRQLDPLQLRIQTRQFGGPFGLMISQRLQFRLHLLERGSQPAILVGQQLNFQQLGLLVQRLIGPCLPRLAFEGIQLLLHLSNDVPHPQKILLRCIQFAQRFGLLFLVANDAGGFFDQLAPVLR